MIYICPQMEPLHSIHLDAGDYGIHIGLGCLHALPEFIANGGYTSVFILCDENTEALCLPHLRSILPDPPAIVISPGELHKSLTSASHIWESLTAARADRRSLLVNLGGGLVGDIGGFAASCYKRGIDFIQVPTTLLAMVDASVGGKTGLNFEHFKNQVGLFRNPKAVFANPAFLDTLPPAELLSGYAELLKHSLISDAARWESLADSREFPQPWTPFIAESIGIKLAIVQEDPFEAGPRKSLNFGHTIGHAIESHLMESAAPLLHGEAVAIGMVCEAFISQQRALISAQDLNSIASTLIGLFGHRQLPASDFGILVALALQDKKNKGGHILCTLLQGIGGYIVDQAIDQADIESALSYYNTLQP